MIVWHISSKLNLTLCNENVFSLNYSKFLGSEQCLNILHSSNPLPPTPMELWNKSSCDSKFSLRWVKDVLYPTLFWLCGKQNVGKSASSLCIPKIIATFSFICMHAYRTDVINRYFKSKLASWVNFSCLNMTLSCIEQSLTSVLKVQLCF